MNIQILIQARSFSKRFPNKIYADLAGTTVLERVYKIANKAATAVNGANVGVTVIGHHSDTPLKDFCVKNGLEHLLSSEKVQPYDLVGRYVEAFNKYKADAMVRLTSDCPVIPSELIVIAIDDFIAKGYDYLSNTCIRSYPDGYDIQVASKKCLQWYASRCRETFYLEHPFSGIDMNLSWRNNMVKSGMKFGHMYDSHNPIFTKISLDTEADLETIKKWLVSNA